MSDPGSGDPNFITRCNRQIRKTVASVHAEAVRYLWGFDDANGRFVVCAAKQDDDTVLLFRNRAGIVFAFVGLYYIIVLLWYCSKSMSLFANFAFNVLCVLCSALCVI